MGLDGSQQGAEQTPLPPPEFSVEIHGSIDAAFEIGPQLSKNIGGPVVIRFGEGGVPVDGDWSRLLSGDNEPRQSQPDEPTSPVSIIGGLAIDPETGKHSFAVHSLRFNTGGANQFDVPGRDIGLVYTAAARGDSRALAAVEALRIGNFEMFTRRVREMRNQGSQQEPQSRAAEIKI